MPSALILNFSVKIGHFQQQLKTITSILFESNLHDQSLKHLDQQAKPSMSFTDHAGFSKKPATEYHTVG